MELGPRESLDSHTAARDNLNQQLVAIQQAHTNEWGGLNRIHRHATGLPVPNNGAFVNVK
jgi:hypothetical protein